MKYIKKAKTGSGERRRRIEQFIDALICAAVIIGILLLLGAAALKVMASGKSAPGGPDSDDMEGVPAMEPLVEFNDESLRWLTVLVYNESKYCTDEHQRLVAMVAVNRLRRPDFGDTWEEIITEPGYPSYYRTERAYGDIDDPGEYQRCMTNALMALHGLVDCPEDLVFQAQFVQGVEVWKTIYVDTGWYSSTTYFCRG